jgi:CheY-like chemotaxis protein
MELNNDQLNGYLRSALHFLYDPSQLRRSPLVDLFNVSKEPNPSAALQKILLDAIEKIRPGQNEPAQARGWLLHDVLFLRYIRGYEREALMSQLALSDRQLSREQKAAIEILGQSLAHDFNLQINLGSPAHSSATATPLETSSAANIPPAPAVEGPAFSWVENLPTERFASWKSILQSVIELLLPVIQKNNIDFEAHPLEGLPDFRVPQSTLRHSLMNIIGVMIPFAQGRHMGLEAGVMDQALTITSTIRPAQPAGYGDPAQELQLASFEVASSLLERVKGILEFKAGDLAIETVITIPAIEEIPVLVIDDNQDTIQLFQRYAQGTRYSILSAASAIELHTLLEQVHPRIILLDLMMPEIDGWDILSSLRQMPLDPPAALVVCSILPMEKVAQSVGADGFLQKPVLPQDFLRKMDEQLNNLLKNAVPGKDQ